MEAFTYADDAVLERIGFRHPRLGQMTVRASAGSPLALRHAKLSKCMPGFLVIGTQKGGTSSLHYMLKSGWHQGISINEGEKEIHYFSFDDNYAKGATVYQQRWDGTAGTLGHCSKAVQKGEKIRGEVSATYLDYPRAAERAARTTRHAGHRAKAKCGTRPRPRNRHAPSLAPAYNAPARGKRHSSQVAENSQA